MVELKFALPFPFFKPNYSNFLTLVLLILLNWFNICFLIFFKYESRVVTKNLFKLYIYLWKLKFPIILEIGIVWQRNFCILNVTDSFISFIIYISCFFISYIIYDYFALCMFIWIEENRWCFVCWPVLKITCDILVINKYRWINGNFRLFFRIWNYWNNYAKIFFKVAGSWIRKETLNKNHSNIYLIFTKTISTVLIEKECLIR